MAEHRPFPPSPRRRGLARHAGLHAASPILVGGLAAATGVAALAVLGRAASDRLGAAIAGACSGTGTGGDLDRATLRDGTVSLSASRIVGEILELALPLVGAVALAALAVHLAQTRAGWLPRRRVDGAPSLPSDAGARTRRSALDLIAAGVIATVSFGWLWWAAPRLAALPAVPLAAGALILAALAALAIAWVGLGTGDALLRNAAVGRALQMTAAEMREDERASSVDPRWRALRAKLSRGRGDRERLYKTAIAGSTLLVLGDGIAVAIAWDPVRRPVPTRTASGRGVEATQLLGLARRYQIAVHREPALANALAGEGVVPEAQWPRLAEIVAAVRR